VFTDKNLDYYLQSIAMHAAHNSYDSRGKACQVALLVGLGEERVKEIINQCGDTRVIYRLMEAAKAADIELRSPGLGNR